MFTDVKVRLHSLLQVKWGKVVVAVVGQCSEMPENTLLWELASVFVLRRMTSFGKHVLILLVRAVTAVFFFLILKEGEVQALLQRAHIPHTLFSVQYHCIE